MAIPMTKRAFTLVELLVVMGIIAVMATMSIGSYFAVVRGMTDRGAIAAATSIISLAHERACIDLTPTVVYFYNELVREANKNAGVDAVVAGVAVAVRRAGRISRVNGNLLNDEYADLDRTYGVAENANSMQGDTFRLYRFDLNRMQFSMVYAESVEDEIGNERYLVEHPVPRGFRKENGDNEDVNRLSVYSYLCKDRNGVNWRAGDAYGYEFARIRLPDNYIFENLQPTSDDPIRVLNRTIPCRPDSTAQTLNSIRITAKRPNGWKEVGNTKREMKDI
jgi:prepilin-type N-terminal cleavage/methylation domain-containing protein